MKVKKKQEIQENVFKQIFLQLENDIEESWNNFFNQNNDDLNYGSFYFISFKY